MRAESLNSRKTSLSSSHTAETRKAESNQRSDAVAWRTSDSEIGNSVEALAEGVGEAATRNAKNTALVRTLGRCAAPFNKAYGVRLTNSLRIRETGRRIDCDSFSLASPTTTTAQVTWDASSELAGFFGARLNLVLTLKKESGDGKEQI